MYDELIKLFLEGTTGKKIIDSLPAAIYAIDNEGRLIYYNSAAADLAGRKPALRTDQWCVSWKLYYPDGTPMPHEESSLALTLKEGCCTEGMESILERPDGKRFWIKAYPSTIRNKEGEVIGGINMIMNITDQKETENQLRHKEQDLRISEKKYRTLFETMDDGFMTLRVEFNDDNKAVNFHYLEVNSAFEKHTGLKNIEGKTSKEVVPDLEEDWYTIYTRVALTGKSAHLEKYVAALDRWFDVSAFRLGEPEERKIAVFFKNITTQKKASLERNKLLQQVKNEQKQLLDIFHHAPSAMCIHRGPDHVIERANELYNKIIGSREVIGKTVREAFPDLEGQGYFELLDQVYETGEPYKGTDMKVVLQHPNANQDPEVLYIDFVYQPIREPDGTINGVFLQGIDLSERKRAQEELKSINETLEERVKKRTESLLSYQAQLRSLASQLSSAEERQRQRLASELHDNLGQLLALSKMKVNLLFREKILDPAFKPVTDLNDLLNDALRYTRELMTDLKPPPSISEDIGTSIAWVAEKLEKHGLRYSLKNERKPKPLKDEIRSTVVQCVRELLYNVIKHTEKKEAVIKLEKRDDQLQVTVKDEGKGFDYKKWEVKPGNDEGFGLFNILERIDLLGGLVNINTKPGRGTKVTISVPLAEEKTVEVGKEKEEDKENGDKTVKPESKPEDLISVLLVDDHRMVREGFRRIIEEEDDIIVSGEAAGGEDAIELARKISPDVILMDINMPGMDGIEATKRITSVMPHVRVIGLSLHDEKRVEKDLINAGASAYLTKSEAFESLIVTIRAEASALQPD
ncbi:MAG: PAS domain S-box protein [Balneolaceae bacterium]